MCGVVGFWGAGDRNILGRMMQAVAHRGPDGEGTYVNDEERLFLGHRRLAIIDLTGGAQPMWNEDGTVGVVFNGEIYNHRELRSQLLDAGHRFKTSHSDTEVLVHGYEEWGHSLPERLNGMFAFAILDQRRRQMFLARDRFGEKPLYYAKTPDAFIFASELSSLMEHPGVDRSLSVRSMQKYFAYGYLPAPNTPVKGARKLPAAHRLVFDYEAAEVTVSRYWHFALTADETLSDEREPELVEELAHLIMQAASRRMISDVPLGVFLSGGIDSSTVLGALAQRYDATQLLTFTIGFTEQSFDESPFARRVADHFGTRHHERILDLSTARDIIPDILSRLDEPLGDASIVPTYLLSKFTRENATVALSGDGGDELFAGYDPFAALHHAQLYDRIVPGWMHRQFRRLADLMPLSSRNMSLDFRIRRTLQGLSYPEEMWLPVWMAPLEPSELAELFEAPVDAREVYSEAIDAWEASPSKSIIDRTCEFFTAFYLQDDILAKVDRASMMCSLETRAVFLDNDLVDFCMRLPNRFKFRNGMRKYLLKKVAARMLPESIVERRKKGFGIPTAEWLKTIPKDPPLDAVPGVRTTYVRKAWDDHRAGTRDNRLFLWSWLSMQHMLSRVIYAQ